MTNLPTRQLGTNGPEITTVGFGAWADRRRRLGLRLGPAGRRRRRSPRSATPSRWASTGSTRPRSTATATRRRSSGAPSPRSRAAERPLVFTKCGLRWNDADRMATAGPRLVGPTRVRQECEARCAGCAREAIDLYQFHWPDETGTPVEDSWGEMLQARRPRARCAGPGVSNFDVRAARAVRAASGTCSRCSRRSR